MFPLFNKFYSPDDNPGTTPPASEPDTFELLSEEEPEEETLELDKSAPKEPEEDEEDEDKEEEPEDELKEIEEELQGPKDEDLELTTPVRRKEILAKYPKLFKDFPYLEKAYYREQQFTETFPTVQDAKVAANKARVLDQVDQQILNGDISTVLQAAKQEDQEAFYKIADNYLPTLRKVDQQAYYHVVGNLIKDTIITMVRESRNLGEQGAPLQAAANILNQFIFGSQNFTPPTPLSRQVDPKEQNRAQQIQYEDQQRFIGQFENVKDDLQTRADNVLRSTISQHIDPKESMTDYVRTHATQEAFQTLEDLIGKDRQFRGLLDRLWEKAFERRFDKESTDRIKSAYLSKAKTLLPSVIKKARNDALRGLGRRVSDELDNEAVAERKRGPITPGKSTSPSSGKFKKASDIPRGMSTLDVLNMKD
jgi:hypothetical protein